MREYDLKIKELFDAHEDAMIFESLPGAGEKLAPRLLAAMGTQREHFSGSINLAQTPGVATPLRVKKKASIKKQISRAIGRPLGGQSLLARMLHQKHPG